MSESGDEHSEILSIVELDSRVHFVQGYGFDCEVAAVRSVRLDDFRGGRDISTWLNTNLELRELWASPQGHLWVGGADGYVATTAPVSWPPPGDQADVTVDDGSPHWTVTALPRLAENGLPPNVNALGGTSDDDVYVGTYEGHLLHWDGSTWTQVLSTGVGYLTAICPAAGGVLVGGWDGLLLRGSGSTWERVDLGDGFDDENVAALYPRGDEVLISVTSRDGSRILRDSPDGPVEILRTDEDILSLVDLDGRLLAANVKGVLEIHPDGTIETIKEVPTSKLYPGSGGHIWLNQHIDRPAFAQHTPHVEPHWYRIWF